MAKPANREEFIQYCLRNLGAPVINIDVDPSQLDDRVDEALSYYYDYHWDGSQKMYYKYQMQQADIDNGYIEIPPDFLGVVDIFDLGSAISYSGGMFSIQYQIALNDLYAFSGIDLIPYWMTMENLQFMQQILVGKQPIRYNRNVNKLYIDMDLTKIAVGQYIVAVVYEKADADLYSDVWNDRWLLNYATALIKQNWGNNLSKFSEVSLPGGIKLNADKIRLEAQAEIKELRTDLLKSSVITGFEIG